MQQPVRIALLSLAGAGLLSLGIWATSAVRAQTSVPSNADEPLPSARTATVSVATTTPTASTAAPTNHHQQRLDDLAKLLGITSSQLESERSSGKPFYQIAAEHKVTYDKLTANQDAQYKAQLDDMVKVGYLTQAEADTAYQQYQTQSQQSPMLGLGMGHGFGHHGFFP